MEFDNFWFILWVVLVTVICFSMVFQSNKPSDSFYVGNLEVNRQICVEGVDSYGLLCDKPDTITPLINVSQKHFEELLTECNNPKIVPYVECFKYLNVNKVK